MQYVCPRQCVWLLQLNCKCGDRLLEDWTPSMAHIVFVMGNIHIKLYCSYIYLFTHSFLGICLTCLAYSHIYVHCARRVHTVRTSPLCTWRITDTQRLQNNGGLMYTFSHSLKIEVLVIELGCVHAVPISLLKSQFFW